MAGRHFIQTKVVGEILMLSGIHVQEFGLGRGGLMIDDIRTYIHSKRQSAKYRLEGDAIKVQNSVMKDEISDDPLLRYFRTGVDCEGC